MLQKEEANIPSFDEWYANIRTRLASDPILRWLHQARTLVVHQGDLMVASTAIATVQNWLPLAHVKLKVPAHLSAKEIAAVVRRSQQQFLGQFAEFEAVLHVERMWSVQDLPDKDLIDVLAYGYCQLEIVVAEAHKRGGRKMAVVHVPDMRIIGGRRLPCMEVSPSFRTSYLNLRDGSPIELTERPFPLDRKLAEKAKKRYGLTEGWLGTAKEQDPFVVAEGLLIMAKKMLVKHKSHVPIAFLILPNNDLSHLVCPMPDQETKYVMYERIAQQIKQVRAKAVIFINEMWTLPMKDWDGKTRPGLSLKRREVLGITVAISDGRVRTYITPFTRGWFGQIKLHQTEIDEEDGYNFLRPIWKIWGIADKEK